jgi:hypothetical protein
MDVFEHRCQECRELFKSPYPDDWFCPPPTPEEVEEGVKSCRQRYADGIRRFSVPFSTPPTLAPRCRQQAAEIPAQHVETLLRRQGRRPAAGVAQEFLTARMERQMPKPISVQDAWNELAERSADVVETARISSGPTSWKEILK